MNMRAKDMFAVAMMCIGVWCLTQTYKIYNSVHAQAGRFLSDAFSAGLTKDDSTAIAYGIGGLACVIAAFLMFGDRKLGKKK